MMNDQESISDSNPNYIDKPTPSEFFTYRGPGAREMNWGQLGASDPLVPNARFYVHNRRPPPKLDPKTWRLRVLGDAVPAPRGFRYEELLHMPSVTLIRAMDCGANGRSFFPKGSAANKRIMPADPQAIDDAANWSVYSLLSPKLAPVEPGSRWLPVAGAAWQFGAMGVAEWTGVRLGDVLNATGCTGGVQVLVTSLDEVQYSHLVPMEKALAEDTLLVYEMNGEPLPIDHGYPLRVLFSGWGANSNVKWVGKIEVSTKPLPLPPAQEKQRLRGPNYPSEPWVTAQNVKSAFELGWNATLPAGPGRITLSGRAWSGQGNIRRVEISAERLDSQGNWQPIWSPRWRNAQLDECLPGCQAWVRFSLEWNDPAAGHYRLMARATDDQGNTQPPPEEVPWNQSGVFYNGHVGHPVTVIPRGEAE